MKILIDATTTQDQYATRGIGRSTYELIKALVERSAKKNLSDEYHLLLFNAPTTLNELVQKYPSLVRTVNIGKLRLSGKYDQIWWSLQYSPVIRREIRTEKPDVYLCPNTLRGFPSKGVPVVCIVYDFAFHRMGRFSFAPKMLDWVRKKQFQHAYDRLKAADGIATISENTKKDLNLFVPNLNKPIIKTVYLGISKNFRCSKVNSRILTQYVPRSVIDQGYILYYGGLEINKNVPSVVRSYIELRRMWQKRFGNTLICPFLVLAGGDFTKLDMRHPILADIRELIIKENIEDEVCFTGYYEEKHAVDLLSAAKVFVHLSLYEGFGFSPLEAMRCGVPVVASDRSCYPETLGEGALLVNPESPHAVASACMRLLTDPELSRRVATEGKIKAAGYSWSNTAKEMALLFDEVLEARQK